MNWKRVSRNIPAKKARVLIWNGKIVCAATRIPMGEKSQWKTDGWSTILRVTHWMPMPPPPAIVRRVDSSGVKP